MIFRKQAIGARRLNNANLIPVEFVLKKENLEARINRVGRKTRSQDH